MNAAAEARLSELDRALDAAEPSLALAEELSAVVDLLAGQPRLRNALADPTMPDDRRRDLARSLFDGRLSPAATGVVAAAAALKWGSPTQLSVAIERQATRAVLSGAQADGGLDAVEEELFRFSRAVAGTPELRSALEDAAAPVEARVQLVDDLLAAKARPETVALVTRAARRGSGSITHALDEQLGLAAALRQWAIATVTVARPLSAEQRDRLAGALVAQLGRPVNLQVVVDPSVLGGARVQVGDEVIEGTVSGRLAQASSQLS